MTNVPFPTLGPAGFLAPAESAILAGIIADLNAAFGGNLNTALETPQGQLAVSMAAVTGFANDLFAFYVSQVDPAFSSGRMQDGIARIYFLERKPAQPTTVAATCTGLAGTTIPTGALAVATDGTKYACLAGGTIPAGGSFSLQFAAVTSGPIVCPAASLNAIFQTIAGWDSISNPADGTPGRAVETRADFEQRRAASVALNALGVLPAVRAAVLNVPGVLDAYATENSSGAPVVVGGVTLPAHSLYVAVSGGAQADVARAIWTKKNPGCAYSGNTAVTVVDDNSGYSTPYPTYVVTYEIPAGLAIQFSVQIAASSGVPSNAAQLIRAAVLSAFLGTDGGPRARIGATLYASRFYAGIAQLGAWAQIVSITIGEGGGALGATAVVRIDQVPTLALSDIAVATV
jgi:hypothetical protein